MRVRRWWWRRRRSRGAREASNDEPSSVKLFKRQFIFLIM
jgi:hypothetical protein